MRQTKVLRQAAPRTEEELETRTMAKVLPFLRAGTCFEPCQVAALCEAYDKVSATLQLADKSQIIKDALAAEIIGLAAEGDCNPDHLCITTLERIARWS